MNEKGNISIAMVVLLLVVSTAVAISGTLFMVQGVSDRVVATTKDVYEKDTALEITKYMLVNEVNNVEIQGFNGEGDILTVDNLQGYEDSITDELVRLGMDVNVRLSKASESPSVKDVCTRYEEEIEGEGVEKTINRWVFCDLNNSTTIAVGVEITGWGEEGDIIKGEVKIEGVTLEGVGGDIQVGIASNDLIVTFN